MAARHGIATYEALSQRSIADPEWFWAAAAEDVGITWMEPYEKVIDLSDGVEFPHFFKGGKLNWADFSVDRWVRRGRGDEVAIWWEGDDGAGTELTYSELKVQIDRAAGAFQAYGVGEGDVIALLLPMIPEAVVTLLAGAKIGAIVAPMFSGYGPQPIRDRLEDSGAKLVVTCDGFPRRGRTVRLKEVADAAMEGIDTVQSVFVVPRLEADVPMLDGRDVAWDEALAKGAPVVDAPAFDVETPCFLIYTSGSTGRPKGCVHTHGGMPFKFAQESRHSLGVEEGTRVLWLTDMGWVMGAWLVTAALTNGGTAVLFEGTPDFPEPDRLWDVAERSRTNVLGIAPTVVRALMADGDSWPDRHALADLRVIATTGEAWNVEPWWWCFRHVGKSRMPIVNFCGGTECGASILAGSLYQPVKPASFSGHTLGMAAEVFDQNGASLEGDVGELVVTKPWPGGTKGLWDGNDRYLRTYWSRFEHVWLQGDFAYIDRDGFWYVLGRSDDTIMLAGKRVGPAEIESLLVDDEGVVEAAAIGVPDEVKGESLVCFVVLSPGADPDATVSRLHAYIAATAGKTVRPKAIYVVGALPKTRNGKVMRRAARAAYLGEALGDMSALDNPEVLGAYQDLVRSS
ncbi:MAG TPA: AMP-binding protein [Acidimicrobiales bacterium]|nr:AMP-binding protein [Acidimicrobiales bacterium]